MNLMELEFSELYVAADGTAELRLNGQVTRAGEETASDRARLAARLVGRLDEGEFDLVHDGVAYRATRIDAEGGIWWALRRQADEARPLASLGIRADVVRRLGELALGRRSGLVLVSGKIAAGKTTTIGALLRHWLEAAGEVAISLESPPEIPMRGRVGKGRFHQIRVLGGGLSEAFGRAVRSTPRYLVFGEIRDAETACFALRAAISGLLVVTTIQAGSVQQALSSLLQLGRFEDSDQAASLMADGLLVVIHQELIRAGAPHLEAQSLFVESEAIRAKIRNRQFGMLKDDVLSQASRGSVA